MYSVADEVRASGGEALACVVDMREYDSIKAAVENTVSTFGGLEDF